MSKLELKEITIDKIPSSLNFNALPNLRVKNFDRTHLYFFKTSVTKLILTNRLTMAFNKLKKKRF